MFLVTFYNFFKNFKKKCSKFEGAARGGSSLKFLIHVQRGGLKKHLKAKNQNCLHYLHVFLLGELTFT